MHLDVAGHETYAYTGARPLVATQPTVVFVHGAAHDHSVWALQSRYFAHHGRNVLAIDLPGHGKSAGMPLPDIAAIAAWLVDLLDAAGVARAAFVGHSMGALACLEMAAAHAARVDKLALLGPSVPMPVSDALLAAARNDDHIAFELINAWSHSVPRQLGGNPVPGQWLTGVSLRLLERSRPGVLHADLAACHGYADGLAAASRVRCPTLVVMGERDLMAPARNAQALIQSLADVRTVTVRGAGHALMTEAPDAVLDALRAFL
ncbi:MAG: alpha/beta fold hydrolase [Burkholderiales bacterium]|nr:alpha/beta fold hydrolase [Burkholderiales bacterium]